MPERAQLAELKIPADGEFIPVAKMVVASLASQLGFTLEEIDELKIAVAQGCEAIIEEAQELWGGYRGVLRLAYGMTERGIVVDVSVLAPKALPGRVVADVPTPPRPSLSEVEMQERALARDVIRLFVDDIRHQVDSGQGQIRVRMVKYVVR
jgi:serine/threonine-protein kinase RsbW